MTNMRWLPNLNLFFRGTDLVLEGPIVSLPIWSIVTIDMAGKRI